MGVRTSIGSTQPIEEAAYTVVKNKMSVGNEVRVGSDLSITGKVSMFIHSYFSFPHLNLFLHLYFIVFHFSFLKVNNSKAKEKGRSSDS